MVTYGRLAEKRERMLANCSYGKPPVQLLTPLEEEFLNYQDEVVRTAGFDLPDVSTATYLQYDGMIRPVEELDQTVMDCANLGIKYWNDKKGTNLELVEVLKANHRWWQGRHYFITLTAKDSLGWVCTYQSRVNSGLREGYEDAMVYAFCLKLDPC